MLRTVVGFTTVAAFMMVVSTAAVAQQPAQPAAQTAAKNAADPNEVVCEKQEETGSRLEAAKICMTRAQWAEQRRLNRKDIDKIQEQRPTR